MERQFTVVLLRPLYLTKKTETDYGKDIYVAHVTSTDECSAVTEAQNQVYSADKKDKLYPRRALDYELCVLFEGIQEPKLFGWQAH